MKEEKRRELKHMSRSFILYSPDENDAPEGLDHNRHSTGLDSSYTNTSNFVFSKQYTKTNEFDLSSFEKKMTGFDISKTKFKKALNATDPLRRVNSMYSPKSVYEELQMVRRVKLPKALMNLHHVLQEYDDSGEDLSELAQVSKYLPYISSNKLVKIEPQMLYSEVNSRSSSTASCSRDPTYSMPIFNLETFYSPDNKDANFSYKMRIGLILSGGPAPGGHNVIAGVFDYLKFRNSESQLIGFIGGLDGLKYKRYHVITNEMMDQYRNLGGFNMLLSGRGMVASKLEFDMVVNTVTELDLDGLIIVGGDGSNSNAANISNYLAHYYSTLTSSSFGPVKEESRKGRDKETKSKSEEKKDGKDKEGGRNRDGSYGDNRDKEMKVHESDSVDTFVSVSSTGTSSARSKNPVRGQKPLKKCVVVGVPKTVDGDIRSKNIEITFGFDTAARTYSELIGNLCTDAASTQFNYHFVRIMGRSASHLALECALQTHPNMLLVSEEVSQKNISLQQIVDDIVNLIEKRYEMGKTFGVILIPEGLIEFIPDFKVLVDELNQIMKGYDKDSQDVRSTFRFTSNNFDINLLDKSKETWEFLPSNIQEQLLMDIESSGCILVAKIATESLLSMLVESRMVNRNLNHLLDIVFTTHYFGYEGRCAIPSEFDSSYCYSLGYTAGVLVTQKKNGYMAAIRGLKNSVEDWVPVGIPFTHLTTLVEAHSPQPVTFPEVANKDDKKLGTGLVKDVNSTSSDKTISVDKKVRCSIRKTLLDLNGELFKAFENVREIWAFADLYRSPGPIQIANPNALLSSASNLSKYIDSYKTFEDLDKDDTSSCTSNTVKDDLFDVFELNERRCYTLQIPTREELLGNNYPYKEGNRCLRTKDRSFMSELENDRLDVVPDIPLVCCDSRSKMVPFKRHFESDEYVKNQIMLHYPYQHKTNHFNQYELVLNNPPQPIIISGRNKEGGRNREGSVAKDESVSRDVRFKVDKAEPEQKPLKIGVVPVGKHAPGILNVFWGIHDRTKQMGGKCYAFHGVRGLIDKSYLELEDEDFDCFRNQGGLELVFRSKRSYLHRPERLEKVLKTCTSMELDGLVFLGDEMSMTQASFVTEYFLSKKSKTHIVGVPVAGGNSVGGNLVEACVGFDTNARIYASLVGNVLTDAISMPKYWHFVKILGRYPSIEVLECALQTHPNVVIIAEEYRNADKTLFDIVDDIANAIVKRSKLGKNYGTVLIPDHLVMHLPNTKNMLQEIGNAINKAHQMNKKKQAIQQLMKCSESPRHHSPDSHREPLKFAEEKEESRKGRDKETKSKSEEKKDGKDKDSKSKEKESKDETKDLLKEKEKEEHEDDEFVSMITPWSLAVFTSFPEYIRREILNLDFGDFTLESLEIEVMLAKMVKEELMIRKRKGEYTGNYAAVTHYFGYQGRCAMPSEFDCSLAYTYGHLAAICVENELSGFCCSIRSVCGAVNDWKLFAIPFTCMMKIAPDSFKMLINPKSEMPIIPSNTVNLNGKAFKKLKSARKKWLIEDLFNNPGPIQFNAFVGTQNMTLIIENSQYYHMITSVERFTEIIKNICKFGVSEEYLHHAFIQLWGLIKITQDKNQLIKLSEDFKLL